MAHYDFDNNETYNNCEECEDLVILDNKRIYCSRYTDFRCIHGTPLVRNRFSNKIISLDCCGDIK